MDRGSSEVTGYRPLVSDSMAKLAVAVADRYRLEREVGAGGMATVYLAEDVRHRRKVALKVLHPELSAVLGGERFLKEIEVTANLQHPHILSLFDSGEAAGQLFYVMPFVEGETLRTRLEREKQLAISDAVQIAREVADALQYAHERGVIHRDIKPENILLQRGHAVVADFGIALAVQEAGGQRMTQTGLSLGTPQYMSPEQAMGERDITGRSDVFSLGCVLYEMLLGEPPFTGPTAQAIVAKVLSERPVAPATRRERISPALEAATLTALEKLPADRFATAAELAAALDAASDTRAQTDAAARVRATRRRRVDWRIAAAGGVLVGAAVAAALLGSRAGALRSGGEVAQAQLTFNGRSGSPAISPDGKYVAYITTRCLRGSDVDCHSSLLVQELGASQAVTIIGDAPLLLVPRFSSDGQSILVAAVLDSARQGVFAVPRAGGLPRRIAPFAPFDVHARGDTIVYVGRGAGPRSQVAHFVTISTGVETDSMPLPDGQVYSVSWAPDGGVIVLARAYSSLVIVRRDGVVADSVAGPVRGFVRWTPDGRGALVFKALAGREDDLIRLSVGRSGRLSGDPKVVMRKVPTLLAGDFDVSRATGKMVLTTGVKTMDVWTFPLAADAEPARQRTSGTTFYTPPSVSPDGSTIYYMRGDAIGDNLYQLRLPDHEEPLTAQPFPASEGGARVSRDGRRVTVSHTRGVESDRSILDLATRQSTPVRLSPSEGYAVVLPLANGAFYLSLQGEVGVMDSLGGPRRPLSVPDSVIVRSADVSPDERTFAFWASVGDVNWLGTTPMDAWQPTWLHRFAAGEPVGDISWSNDGWISVWLWRAGEATPSIWGLRRGAAPLVRRADVPAACNVRSAHLAPNAPIGTCLAVEDRRDVWVLDVPAIAR